MGAPVMEVKDEEEKQKGGQPMGSTNKNKAKVATRVIMAKNHATVEFEK